MNFAKAELLLLFLCIPLLVYYFRLILKISSARREKFFTSRNYQALSNFTDRPYRIIKIILFLVSMSFIIFAAARPQGLEKLEEYQAQAIDVCFVIDASDSMRAQDLGPDSRLEITKAVTAHLIDSLKTDRIGIIAFAGDASCICPLTMDHNAAKTLLGALDFSTVEKGGTRIDYAIEMARARFTKEEDIAKVIIVFTDGESLEGKPVEAAKKAYREGIIINTVGIGSTSGVQIPISRGPFGDIQYKKYKGREIVTKLNEDMLKSISAAAEGTYYHVSDQASLDKMIGAMKKMSKRAVRAASAGKREELFFYFALAAFIFLSVEAFLPSRVLKKEAVILAAVFLTACFAQSPALALSKAPDKIKIEESETASKIDGHIKDGMQRYRLGDFHKAEADFEGAKILDPKNFVTNYNVGCSRYKNNDYKNAINSFNEAISSDPQKTQFEPYYNRGNSFFRLDDYQQAVNSYEEALKVKPDDENTRHNLELARKKLEEQKKKQEQQNKENGKDDKNEDDKKDGKGEENKQEKGDKGQDQKQDGKDGDQKKSAENKDEKDKKDEGQSAKEGDEKGKEQQEVKNLADKENIEKYKNLQVDPNRVKMFLKDLENDEARVNQLYNQNKKRMKKPSDIDLFNMSPEEVQRHIQKQLNGEEEDDTAGDTEKKDW